MFIIREDTCFLYFFAVCIIFLTTLFVRLGIQKNIIHSETGRKILHLVAIMTCVIVLSQTQDRTGLAYIFFGFSVVLFVIAHKNVMLPSPRKSYGIALFPVAFGLLLLLPIPLSHILFAMITLGVSDALAGVAGEHFARKKYIFLYEQKSWLGFIVFYISTIIIGCFFIGWTPVLLILALVPALSELFSYRGSDNLTVPLIAAFWISVIQQVPVLMENWLVFVFVLIMLAFVFIKKWLSMEGIAAAGLLAIMVIFSVGPVYLIPLAIFFVAGSLTSKLHPKSGDASGRNAFQVFANGLVAVILLLVYFMTYQNLFLLASFASVAISLADTLSSDIGIFFKHKTYDITTFRPVKAGLSGGVSLVGSLAGAVGSFGFAIFVGFVFLLGIEDVIWIGVTGITGMIADSILGSLFQAKYIRNNDITEEKTGQTKLIKGFSWLNNDGVNLLANVLIITLFIRIAEM